MRDPGREPAHSGGRMWRRPAIGPRTGPSRRAPLAVAVVAVLAVVGLLPVAADATSSDTVQEACPSEVPSAGYGDVATDTPHAATIDCVTWWRIARGVNADRFAPRRTVTRAQVATFVARLLRTPGGLLPASPADRFGDDAGSVHHFAINRLAEAAVLRGRAVDRFAPEAPASRGQVASVLAAAYEHRTGRSLPSDATTFTDIDDSVHREAIEKLATADIARGVTRDRFEPASPLTRAQTASFTARLLDRLASDGHLPESPATLRQASDLRDFDGCEDLLGHLKERGLEQVGPYGLDGIGFGGRIARPAVPGAGASDDADSGESPTDGGAGAPPDFSETNVQEEGVDEPDIVKTDGRHLFSVTDGLLRAVDVTGESPAVTGEMALRRDRRHELLLHGDRVLTMANDWSDGPRAVLTSIDVADPSAMRSEQTVEIDGSFLTARMVDGVVRAVIRTNPDRLEFIAPDSHDDADLATAAAHNRAVIENSTLAEWLPHYRDAAGEHTLLDCTTLSHPPEYSGLGSLSVVTFDLARGRFVDDASEGVLAGGEIVYASRTGLYVATARWQSSTGGEDGTSEQTTEVHAFDISAPDDTSYRASGKVPGWVLNQFALSERDGYLRVATTSDAPWDSDGPGESESRLTVLEEQGDLLVPVGDVAGLGRGERIYAVRYVDDLAYVVTFRLIDPLYVVDLSDPRDPTLRGELKIAGYSAYLHPIGDGLLLGVGQNATEDGQTTGTQLSLFDVADPSSPRRLHTVAVEDGSSEVEWDHRAFLWWDPADLVFLPVNRWSQDEESGEVDRFFGAIGWRLDWGDGFVEVGRVSHFDGSDRAGDDDSGDPSVRRSVVIGDALFTVSARGLLESDLETLEDRTWIPFD